MRDDRYDDYDPNEEMLSVASHCSRFSRRRDVNSFNMSNYQSCDNCRHMSADNQCIMKMADRLTQE